MVSVPEDGIVDEVENNSEQDQGRPEKDIPVAVPFVIFFEIYRSSPSTSLRAPAL